MKFWATAIIISAISIIAIELGSLLIYFIDRNGYVFGTEVASFRYTSSVHYTMIPVLEIALAFCSLLILLYRKNAVFSASAAMIASLSLFLFL
ncbi:MAG: hypothetical protein ACLFWF_05335 [Alphaproteobacteria bacterium]